jgi:ferrous iron transport protein B
VMEIPAYQRPQMKSIFAKTWLRMKDFVVFAWPVLIVGSLVLSLSTYYQMDQFINRALSPLTRLLDLPQQVGVTLVFGILRKELSLVMLMQALGTTDIGSVLSHTQIVVFTLFVVFYFPCLATWGILGREIGWPRAIAAAAGSLILAISIALCAKWLLPMVL